MSGRFSLPFLFKGRYKKTKLWTPEIIVANSFKMRLNDMGMDSKLLTESVEPYHTGPKNSVEPYLDQVTWAFTAKACPSQHIRSLF